jgi:hypothetical protein
MTRREDRAKKTVQLGSTEQLRLFIVRAEELEKTRLGSGNFHVGVKIEMGVGKPTLVTPNFPPEEDLRSFLLTFRQFVSEREPVFLPRIHNLCHLKIDSDLHRRGAAALRTKLSDALRASEIVLIYNGKELTPEETLDLFIDGWYFHSDPEKRGFLEGLAPQESTLVKHRFLDLLIPATEVVFHTRDLLVDAFEKGLVRD